jgi:hypothetical protein
MGRGLGAMGWAPYRGEFDHGGAPAREVQGRAPGKWATREKNGARRVRRELGRRGESALEACAPIRDKSIERKRES